MSPAWLIPESGLVHRPATIVPLVLVSIGFLCKYGLSIVLIHQPELASNPGYCAFYASVSGLIDGVFWGGTFLQLYQVHRHNENPAA